MDFGLKLGVRTKIRSQVGALQSEIRRKAGFEDESSRVEDGLEDEQDLVLLEKSGNSIPEPHS